MKAIVTIFFVLSHTILVAQSCLPKEDALVPYRKVSKWGYTDVAGKVIIPFVYDSAGQFGYNKEKKPYARVKQRNVYKLIDTTNQEINDSVTDDKKGLIIEALIILILEEQHRKISIELHSKFKNGKYGLIIERDTIIPPIYDKFGFMDDKLVALKKDKWNLFNTRGTPLTTIGYDSIFHFWGNDVTVMQRDGKFGLLDRKGNEVLQPTYQNIYPVDNGSNLIVAKRKKKFGLIDRTGRVVVPFEYSLIGKFYFQHFKLFELHKKGELFGFINCEGKKYFE